MPKNLEKLDIEFDEARIFKQAPLGEAVTLHVAVGYKITTVEGEIIQRNIIQELTGAQLTRATDFLDGVKTAVRTLEGL